MTAKNLMQSLSSWFFMEQFQVFPFVQFSKTPLFFIVSESACVQFYCITESCSRQKGKLNGSLT